MIEIRPATIEDAPQIAKSVNISTNGLMSTILGTRWHETLTRVVMVPDHELSYENARIAQNSHSVLGVALSCSGSTPKSDFAFRHMGSRFSLRAALLFLAASPIFRFLGSHDSTDWHLTSLSVNAESRGHGIGSALLADFMHIGTRNGASRLTIDVDMKNHRARQLYEREEFVETSRSRRAFLLGGAQVARLSRET